MSFDFVERVWPPDSDAVVTEGAFQVYCVPFGTSPSVLFEGTALKNTPPQTVLLIGLTLGKGVTFICTVKVPPAEQEVMEGVTTYVAVAIKLEVAVRLPLILV